MSKWADDRQLNGALQGGRIENDRVVFRNRSFPIICNCSPGEKEWGNWALTSSESVHTGISQDKCPVCGLYPWVIIPNDPDNDV